MRSTRLVIAVAFASGCTSSSSVTTLDDLYAQLADALCQKEATCGGIGRSETSACVQQVLASVMHAQAYDYRGALAARRIVLNGDQGSACIAALRAASCTNGLIDAFGTDACAHIFTPEVATGGACQNSVECIAGYCSAQTSGCTGACVAFIPTGASCANATGNCATTDFCEPISGLCTARGGAGYSCMGTSYCQSGLHCVGVQPGGMPGTCSERAGVGSACASSYDCAGGLFCNTFTNSPSVCQAVLSPGASCPGPGSCADGQVCGGGVCTAILDVSVRSRAVRLPRRRAVRRDAPHLHVGAAARRRRRVHAEPGRLPRKGVGLRQPALLQPDQSVRLHGRLRPGLHAAHRQPGEPLLQRIVRRDEPRLRGDLYVTRAGAAQWDVDAPSERVH
jgi:hypothetical protein